MFKHPFSFNGRIRRTEFGLSFIIYFICYIFLSGAVSSRTEGIGFIGIALIPLIWFIWAQGAKRCHDLGKNGFWLIVPFYVFWMLFVAGDPNENEYGVNPKFNEGIPIPDLNGNSFDVIAEDHNSRTSDNHGHIDLSKNSNR